MRLYHRLRVPSGDDWKRLPTVLLVHGLDSASDTFDDGVLDDVGKVYRTVAVDLRGHGRSASGMETSAWMRTWGTCSPSWRSWKWTT